MTVGSDAIGNLSVPLAYKMFFRWVAKDDRDKR
jgi:hypothetical protein